MKIERESEKEFRIFILRKRSEYSTHDFNNKHCSLDFAANLLFYLFLLGTCYCHETKRKEWKNGTEINVN